ncbi:hypothetical protein Lal_00042039 [Lupinus albus]|nr:hypothetical protein Lal_00042039 [Lupinus albus]
MDRMGDSAPNAYIMRRIPTYGPKVTPRTDNYDLKSIPGLETVEVVFMDSWGGTDRRSLSQWIEWEILPQMHILCVEFRRTVLKLRQERIITT